MVSKKKLILGVLSILLIVFCSLNVFALGIAPAKTVVPNEVGEHKYTGLIINNEKLDGDAKIILSDEFSLVTLEQESISLQSDQYEIPFTYTITVPENNEFSGKIGELTVGFVATDQGSQVSAQTQTISPIYIGTESQKTSPNTYSEPKPEPKVSDTKIKEPKQSPQIVQKAKNAATFSSRAVKDNILNNSRLLFTIISLLIIVTAALYIFWPYLKRDDLGELE